METEEGKEEEGAAKNTSTRTKLARKRRSHRNIDEQKLYTSHCCRRARRFIGLEHKGLVVPVQNSHAVHCV
jgi:hypothetical protein